MPAKQRRTQNFIGRGNARYRVFTGTGSSEHIRLFSFSLFITFLLFGYLRGIKRVVGKLFITLTASPLVTETIAPRLRRSLFALSRRRHNSAAT